jgi:hypothetical protein
MIREFQNFGEELNCSREMADSTKFPPNTFIAYWTVLKEFLNEFNSLVIQIEVKVKKQGMNFNILKHILQQNCIVFTCVFWVMKRKRKSIFLRHAVSCPIL